MNQNQESANKTLDLSQAARILAATNSQAVLSTLRTEDGYPYTSAVDYLGLANGDILMLLSSLAEHEKYFTHDPRASILIVPGLNSNNMLAEGRLTLLGQVIKVNEYDRYRGAYLARHPQAGGYIDFVDFSFYRLCVEKARYIAGFGRMGWLSAEEYQATNTD